MSIYPPVKPVEVLIHRREDIDDDEWDNFINDSCNGSVFSYHWYLDTIAPNWEAAICYYENGAIAAVMPLPYKNYFSIKVSRQPILCRYGGIIYPQSLYSHLEQIRCISTCILAEISRKYLWVHLYQTPGVWIDNLSSEWQKNEAGNGYGLFREDFAKGNPYNATNKNLYNKAQKMGFKYEIIQSADPLIEILDNLDHKIIDKSKYEVIKALYGAARVFNAGTIHMATDLEKNNIAVAFTLQDARASRLLFLNKGNDSNDIVNRYLLCNVIEECLTKSPMFDFCGSNIKGVADFFESFGAHQFRYQYLIKQGKLVTMMKNLLSTK
ncbi:MAG: hypothetical protein SGJ04_00505 [Bacteroidota bacterium]|nr:hypothetical protein [Bacteroidota bacterium]